MHLDIACSLVIYTCATLAFYLLGAGVLHRLGLEPQGSDMIVTLSRLYTETLGGWALWLFAKHETGLLPGQATNALIEEGPYRLSRNPLYVGLLALYLALALLAPTFWGLLLFPLAVALVFWGAIRPEERFLHRRFGAHYDDYAQRVRRWL